MSENAPILTIRMLDEADAPALARVAGRDSALAPCGPVLGAFEDGTLVAALALGSGRIVADPFVPTGGAVAMLHARRDQIDGSASRARSVPRTALHPATG